MKKYLAILIGLSMVLACKSDASPLKVAFTVPDSYAESGCSSGLTAYPDSIFRLGAKIALPQIRTDVVWEGPESGNMVVYRTKGTPVSLELISNPAYGRYTITVRPRIELPDTSYVGCAASVTVDKLPPLKPAAILNLRGL